jgi:hypothetical protein
MATIFSNPRISRQPAPAAKTCCCPACTGIECFDRPTFFAGQLLNETDLNAEIDYVVEKNRLHNRYLHGPGTVCGLDVTCGDCDGTVNISAGYAIDPCGNDIVVCTNQTFDVIKAIKACAKTRKKGSTTGCQPYQPPTSDCSSLTTEEWCITLEYKESPTQPVTPLINNQKSSCSCGCGGGGRCGCGGGGGCSCGGGSSKSSSGTACGCSSSSSTSSQSTTTQTCQPTRTHEGYSIGVCAEPPDCGTLAGLMKTTLLERIIQCITGIFTNKGNRFTATTLNTSITAMTGDFSQVNTNDAQDTCCRLLLFIDDLFSNSPFPVRCELTKLLADLKCAQRDPAGNQAQDAWLNQSQTNIQGLITLLFEYIRECICHALLPPCPCDPCDDRLIIACVTVQNGKITEICNFGCRQFAGGFPSFFYWLSLIPIVPLLKFVAEKFCCGDALLHKNSPLVNEVTKWMDSVDPSGTVRKAVVEGNFALPKLYFDRLTALPSKAAPSNLAQNVPANGVNLAPLAGQKLSSAASTLGQANITYVEKQVTSMAAVPASVSAPVVAPGSKVIIYTDGTNILDIQPYPVELQLADHVQQINDLQSQLTSLRATVEKLGPVQRKE